MEESENDNQGNPSINRTVPGEVWKDVRHPTAYHRELGDGDTAATRIPSEIVGAGSQGGFWSNLQANWSKRQATFKQGISTNSATAKKAEAAQDASIFFATLLQKCQSFHNKNAQCKVDTCFFFAALPSTRQAFWSNWQAKSKQIGSTFQASRSKPQAKVENRK